MAQYYSISRKALCKLRRVIYMLWGPKGLALDLGLEGVTMKLTHFEF